MRPTLRRLGLGRLAYSLYHAPLGAIRDSIAAGGPIAQWSTARGRNAMERAAAQLPPLPSSGGPPTEVHLLTGRRFWYQTAFCLWSLARTSGRPLAPVIYDDGSLPAEHQVRLARLFPSARFVTRIETIARLDEHLPAEKFPVLRERWLHYPNIRKLTDPHAGHKGWKLILDSDLLFFRRPDFLLAWIDNPDRPLHAVDCETSYGYDRTHMNELAGAPVADLVNVGLTGLEGGGLDWEKIEHWTRELQSRGGTSYYLEQALIAMLVAGRDCAVAPAADYITLPRPPEAADCRAVMHHYVAGSKREYFRHNWRRTLASAPDTP
jgi:hypothetical protein